MFKLKSKEFIIQSKLLYWYKKNKRSLPWRKLKKNNLPDPYYVMISEFMLQQTTINAVVLRFKDFVNFWPSIKKLSTINENQILQFWSGLGYYARAKNLFKTTKIISLKFKNIIPNNYEDLIKLPGVGDYTAKAILGIGFNQPVMPVDANIERILSRLYALKKPINKIKKNILKLAELYISKKQSSSLIQAFMDYGSIICVPINPKCNICIIADYCEANKKKITNIIPLKKKSLKEKPKKYTRAYVILSKNNEVLVRRRSTSGMLPSMLEVPNDQWTSDKKMLVKDRILKLYKKKLMNCNSIIYSFSHFNLEIDIFVSWCRKRKIHNYKWIPLNKVSRSGMPTVMKKIVTAATN